ncbi:MAG TPA: zinc finger Ran-binding domain-containing protein [Gemmatimonadales bacterium]|nr:zinc finger Ran-binding domain-containing protein [Gemmatimonadales bacterium]
MAETTTSTGAPIEALLQERARFQEWLARLDATAGAAPATVRDKVRGDYEGRLRRVMDELKSHSDTIRNELERHRASKGDLETRRSAAEEALAEARIRHAVGEYSDDEWRRLSEETSKALGALQAELSRVGAEIARLVEVQGLIMERPRAEPAIAAPQVAGMAAPMPSAASPSAAAAAVAAPPIDMLPDPTPDFAAAAGSPSPVEPVESLLATAPPHPPPAPSAAPRFVPKPTAEPARSRPATSVDELTFLKSVSSDRAGGTASPRRSGETLRPEAPPEPAPSAPAGGAKNQAKTLKCGECGTLNRPTEWYCERCGAELAAL